MSLLERFHLLQERRRLNRALALRRAARAAYSAAAKAGHSTYWRRAGEQCRRTFGEHHGPAN